MKKYVTILSILVLTAVTCLSQDTSYIFDSIQVKKIHAILIEYEQCKANLSSLKKQNILNESIIGDYKQIFSTSQEEVNQYKSIIVLKDKQLLEKDNIVNLKDKSIKHLRLHRFFLITLSTILTVIVISK